METSGGVVDGGQNTVALAGFMAGEYGRNRDSSVAFPGSGGGAVRSWISPW